jgi:hypothetical protein
MRTERELTLRELEKLPTIDPGQFANLKVNAGGIRIWLSRMTVRDGEREPIYVEFLENGRWVDIKDTKKYAQAVYDIMDRDISGNVVVDLPDEACIYALAELYGAGKVKNRNMYVSYLMRNEINV